eukprot:TRINITY_DN10989_c0_g1_i2.p1 TRINITY_DN10989_c0_g1~~TRINITY_DN10989_c0_g1_i2.p1  ORF type:complete len:949 (+),score=393.55 TRINITY_DN10989_c0_g1_i2:85-2931(+)
MRTSAHSYSPYNVWRQSQSSARPSLAAQAEARAADAGGAHNSAASGPTPPQQGRAHYADNTPPAAPEGGAGEQQSVAYHLTRVATHNKSRDAQLERGREELERKGRQCSELEAQVAQHKAYAKQLKDRLEQEVASARAEVDDIVNKKQAQHDADRRQLSDLLGKLRAELAEARAEAQEERALRERLQGQQADAVGRVAAERDRVAQQADALQQSSSRRLNEAQMELARQGAALAEAEREAAEKDRLCRQAQQETSAMREHLERVARELVSRNRAGEEEVRRRVQDWNEERNRLMTELAAVVEDKRDWHAQELRLKEEILVLKAHWDKAQAHGEEQAMALSAAEARVKVLEEEGRLAAQEIRDLTEQVATVRGECDQLHEARARIDKELRRAGEELAHSDEQLRALRDELQETSDDVTAAQRDRNAFAAKMTRSTEGAREELRALVSVVDGFREAVFEHMAAEQRAAEPPQRAELAETERAAAEAWAAPGPQGEELAAAALSARLRDELAVAGEDLRLVRADVADELARARDLARQHRALQDAYVVDREHLESLTTSLNEANAAYARLTAEKQVLEEGYAKHDAAMAEAVRLSQERDEQRERLLGEVRELREALSSKGHTDDSLQQLLQEQEQRLQAARDEAGRLAGDCADLRRAKAEAGERMGELEAELRRAEAQGAALRADLKRAEEARDAALARAARAEGDSKFQEQHSGGAQREVGALRGQLRAAEDENRQMRDELARLCASAQRLQTRCRDLEGAHRSTTAQQEQAEQWLESARVTADAMREARDGADRRTAELEASESRLQRTVGELRREADTLWHALETAQVECDARARAMADTRERSPRAPPSPEPVRSLSPGGQLGTSGAGMLLRSPVAAASPMPGHYDHLSPSGRAGSPQSAARLTGDGGSVRSRRRLAQEERLREIEQRVSGLLATRVREMEMLTRHS